MRGGFRGRSAIRAEGGHFGIGESGFGNIGGDHLAAQGIHQGDNRGDVFLAHAQIGHCIAQMRGHPVKLAVADRQTEMGLGQVAPIILFGATKRLGNEQGLMAFQRPHIHLFENGNQVRVNQYPIVKPFHQGSDDALTA